MLGELIMRYSLFPDNSTIAPAPKGKYHCQTVLQRGAER